MISVDTGVLLQLIQDAKNASSNLTEASEILNQITTHSDWGCPERETINDYIQKNRALMQKLMENAAGFAVAMEQTGQKFTETESGIADLFDSVDQLIGKVMAVPVSESDLVFGDMTGTLKDKISSINYSIIMGDIEMVMRDR